MSDQASGRSVKPVNQKMRFWIVRLAVLACVPLIVLAMPVAAGYPLLHRFFKVLGTLLLIAAVIYRFWAILYIGGRKNQQVVQDGPYSMSRHPLYFGTTLGALGFGLMLGSVLMSVLLGGVALVILNATARREERFLRAEFGPAYDTFAQRVPNRILPQTARFRTEPEVTFSPRILRYNLADALGFLICIPLVEIVEGLRSLGLPGAFPVF